MRPFTLLSATLALTLPIAAQAPAAPSSTPTSVQDSAPKPSSSDTVLQTGTQLVVVDVVVEDKDGRPVHGLKPSNFKLSESKTPVALHSFEEHTPATAPATMPTIPKMPPGIFTNYTPIPPSGTLNILLLDSLNTPTKDQMFVRAQLAQYVKHAPAGTHIAIFGLTSRLILLQGFTSDPETLKDAVGHKLLTRASDLLSDPTGSNVDTESMADSMTDLGADAQVVANVAEFEAQTAAFQTQLRIQYTLDAFNTLGHYLAAFPGRKNLIWFSGSFPINILPDATLADPFVTVHVNEEEFRETINLLTQAQVAVYPIDARGLMTEPAFDAANSGAAYARPGRFTADIAKFAQSQAEEHGTMESLAQDTGGHAFYNTNDLATSVARAIDAGSSYYTLTYAPPNRNYDGRYRTIHLDLVDAPSGLQLAYRHGYYADDPNHLRKNEVAASAPAPSSKNPTLHTADYVRASMSRGAPTPQDILFKVRVLPATTGTEPTPAKGNILDPRNPIKGPFQRLALDFVSLPRELAFIQKPDGLRVGAIEYLAYLYDADGKLLNTDARALQLNLNPQNYSRFIQGAIEMHLDISAPLKPATYLRIGLHDLTSNRMGVVEVPVASISHLAPPPPPSTPSTPRPSSPTPSTPSAPPASPRPSTPH
jgi:VWFA-related protein